MRIVRSHAGGPELFVVSVIGFAGLVKLQRAESFGRAAIVRKCRLPGTRMFLSVLPSQRSQGRFFRCGNIDTARPDCWPFAPAGRLAEHGMRAKPNPSLNQRACARFFP